MKTLKTLLIITISFITISLNGQIKITTSGYVGINQTTPKSQLDVNGNISISNSTNPMGIINENPGTTSPTLDLDVNYVSTGRNPNNIGGNFKIDTRNTSTYPLFQWNYWTAGFGSNLMLMQLNSSGQLGIGFTPQYTVDLGTTGLIRAKNISPSDSVLKTNIQNLTGAMPSLLKLKGVTYKFKSSINKLSNAAVDTSFINRTQIGLISEDVEKILPQLIYTDKNGVQSLDYQGLIPVIIETCKSLYNNHLTDSIANNKLTKQLKSDSLLISQLSNSYNTISNQVTSLTSQLNQCCGKTTTKAVSQSDQVTIGSSPNLTQNMTQSEVANLAQNAPNPFSQNTTIGYYIPSNVVNAVIYIYNLQGAQINSFPISDRGNGSIVISGNSLAAGMYIYSLITDGTLIDTKKMILTN